MNFFNWGILDLACLEWKSLSVTLCKQFWVTLLVKQYLMSFRTRMFAYLGACDSRKIKEGGRWQPKVPFARLHLECTHRAPSDTKVLFLSSVLSLLSLLWILFSLQQEGCQGLLPIFLVPCFTSCWLTLWSPIPRSQVWIPISRSQHKSLWNRPSPIVTVAMSLLISTVQFPDPLTM